jgi:hypothetical protein
MWSARLVQTAAELGIADVIDDEPVAVSAVAESVGADPAMLRRLMRALASHGVFRPVEDDRYAHTELSRSLRATAPGGVRHLALLAGSKWCMTVCERLNSAVRTGENPFRAHYGKDIWTYLAEDAPEAAAIFHGTMTQISGAANGPIVDALDLTDMSTIADVGGGEGSLIRSLLERHPGMEGAIVDSEAALRGADGALRADGPLTSRCLLVPGAWCLVPGDCLREVPYSADVYLFKWVLHQWDDDTCVRVLGNCAEHARPGARVIIAERTMSETPPPSSPSWTCSSCSGRAGECVRRRSSGALLMFYLGVCPTLREMDVPEWMRIHASLDRSIERYMPVLNLVTSGTSLILLFLSQDGTVRAICALACNIALALTSEIINVPLNKVIARKVPALAGVGAADVSASPEIAEMARIRERWIRWTKWRAAVITAGFLLYAVAVVRQG